MRSQPNSVTDKFSDKSPSNQLSELVARHTATEGAQATAVPSLGLYRSQSTSEPIHTVYQPSLGVIAQGAKVVTLGSEVRHYASEQFLLVAVNLPVTSQLLVASPEKPHLALHVKLDLGFVSRLMTELDLPDTPRPQFPLHSGFSIGVLEPLLQDAVLRLARLLDTPEHIPMLEPLIMREICYLLLCSPQGAELRQIASESGPSYRIATAIEQLVKRFDQTLKVEQLAAEVNMSVSSFYQHFKVVTKLTPLQFQKQLRLQEARRLLLTQETDVTGASFQVGYESLSQFSREYHRLFGVPPSRDIARFRSGNLLS